MKPQLRAFNDEAERWYGRAARGALAGLAGTVAMSLVQWPAAHLAASEPPPVEIAERLHRMLPARRRPHGVTLARAILLHLAFGTVAGALYGLAAPTDRRELTGMSFGGALWAASYFGWLPLLGIHRPAYRDDALRQAGNAVAHLVFGLSLAEGMRLSAR